ncbi:MAG: DUF3857 domain-containing protein [Ginsengibacter sp.]
MRKYYLSLLLVLTSTTIFAQKELPAYGKIDKADLLLKECEFDKDAEAYTLLNYGDVYYNIVAENFNIVTNRRTRIKILKEKGLDRANIKLHFYSKSNYEEIRNISGVTYNIDNAGNVVTTKLEKSSVYIKKLNNKVSEVSFTMPDVKVGSVIEFKYTDTKKSIRDLDDWYFQDDIPTRISSYRIRIPSVFRFATQVLTYQPIEKKDEIINDNLYYKGSSISTRSEEKTYVLKNVPALRDEPFMGAEKDYLQRIVSQLNSIVYANGEVEEVQSTWPKLTEDLLADEDFGLQLKKNLPHTKSLDDSLKNVQDDYHRMILIHDYVRRNMNWNGRESIYSSDGIKSAWDKKSGSNAELNFILIDLLRDAGIKAYPILVSTKDNGTVNTIYPFLEQFNNTMTCVFIGDKRYILNAADKYNPAYLIPYDVLDNDAFVVDKDHGGWIKLSNNNDTWRNVVTLFAQITPDALMEGNATVYSYGYSRNPREKKWIEDKSNFKDYFTKGFTAMKVENIQVENQDKDTLPLQQKLDFSLPVNSSGEYKYFTLNLFQGLEKNPFIADERQTDIEFNYPQSYTLVGKVTLPDGYEFDDLPKSVKMIMPDSSITLQRLIQPGNGSIDFRISLDFFQSYYSANAYPLLQEFYKKLFTTLNEQIVIKKKKTDA